MADTIERKEDADGNIVWTAMVSSIDYDIDLTTGNKYVDKNITFKLSNEPYATDSITPDENSEKKVIVNMALSPLDGEEIYY